MNNIGFIGFGSMGQLLGKGFAGDFNVAYFDPSVTSNIFMKHVSIKELATASDVIIVATPSSSFNDVLISLSELDLSGKLIVDVLSTKTYAAKRYNEVLPSAQVLSIHPLFGPPSYTTFAEGMRVVTCLNKGSIAVTFEYILASKYGFKIIKKTAQEHDEHMAFHHAIPFFLAHALSKTDFKKDPGDLTIPSEEKLRKIIEIAGKESMDLYMTIMKSNPHAKKAVEYVLKTIYDEYKLLWQ